MLFNSYAFLFGFLPLTLLAFYGLRSAGRRSGSVLFLALASVAFYAYWKPANTLLLVGSIVCNYFIARWMTAAPPERSRLLLTVGITANLLLLCYFKYFDFLLTNAAWLAGIEIGPRSSVIPAGISFFTFTQIAYLVDCHRSRTHERVFSSYTLFVTIFPHLIAGPIIHHSQMRPQFARLRQEGILPDLVVLGLVTFVIGLAKKVLIADNLVAGADAAFGMADAGAHLTAAAAWTGAVAYTLQIYFDFSGYSDMAIGLALLFGLRLPLNFDSPYKAQSIIEFWRRWHMTLSAWLRDYIYIPLRGNRHGERARLRNVFVTFLLGGIWHGAGWTFVIWGALHGSYVVINHLLRKVRGEPDSAAAPPPPAAAACKRAVTLLIVMIAWVFFRAKTVGGALGVLGSMAFLGPRSSGLASADATLYFWMVLAAVIALAAPSTQQLTRYTAKLGEGLSVANVPLLAPLRSASEGLGTAAATALVCGVLFAAALACIWRPAIFIYFNF